MDIFQGLSDDQTALLGCFAALALSGLMMTVSVYIGRARSRDEAGKALVRFEASKTPTNPTPVNRKAA